MLLARLARGVLTRGAATPTGPDVSPNGWASQSPPDLVRRRAESRSGDVGGEDTSGVSALAANTTWTGGGKARQEAGGDKPTGGSYVGEAGGPGPGPSESDSSSSSLGC
jgi:hypothetical protein